MVLVWCSEMERLRKEREAKELAARSKARAAKEERRMQQLSEEERLKEERAAQSQEAARELRVKRKQAKCVWGAALEHMHGLGCLTRFYVLSLQGTSRA